MANWHYFNAYYSECEKEPSQIFINIDNITKIVSYSGDKKFTLIGLTDKGVFLVKQPYEEVVSELLEYNKKNNHLY